MVRIERSVNDWPPTIPNFSVHHADLKRMSIFIEGPYCSLRNVVFCITFRPAPERSIVRRPVKGIVDMTWEYVRGAGQRRS